MTELINTALIVFGILGFGWIQRSFIGMVIKTTIQLLIKDSIDREQAQKALIFETLTTVKSSQPEPQDVNNIVTMPVTTSEVNKLKDEIEFLKNDVTLFLPHVNKNQEAFREEIVKLLEASQCPPELREKCIEHFLEIKKAINNVNGNLGEVIL